MSATFFVIFVTLATALLMAPVARYLHVGWFAKRADILDGQSGEARQRYFSMFHRSEAIDAVNTLSDFEAVYDNSYGRARYIVPTALLLAVGFVAVYVVIGSAMLLDRSINMALVPVPIPPLGLAALSGAYLWVVNDFIRRARKLDFSPSDIYWGVLRFVIAIPLGYGFSSATPETGDIRNFIAFSIGAFPLSTILGSLRRITLLRLDLSDPENGNNDNVIKLLGVNAEIADRLANEDITTITQLAYCDPIRLTMRSNLSFNFVTDCMNQALAWEYLEDQMNRLRPLGLRGAVEIRHLYQRIGSGGNDDEKEAEEIMACVADTIKQDRATLKMVFTEISEDPFTLYLDSIWVTAV